MAVAALGLAASCFMGLDAHSVGPALEKLAAPALVTLAAWWSR